MLKPCLNWERQIFLCADHLKPVPNKKVWHEVAPALEEISRHYGVPVYHANEPMRYQKGHKERYDWDEAMRRELLASLRVAQLPEMGLFDIGVGTERVIVLPSEKTSSPADSNLLTSLRFEHRPPSAPGLPEHELAAYDDSLQEPLEDEIGPWGKTKWSEEKGFVGYIHWYDTEPPVISAIEVHKDYKRKGLATELFNRARQITPELRPSSRETEEGAKWKQSLGSKNAQLIVHCRNGRDMTLDVEVASDSQSIRQGLMNRPSMPFNHGMVFLYPYPPSYAGFWMKNTLIPLSIAFWDQTGVITQIIDMEPCLPAGDCMVHYPSKGYWGAVEVNKGVFRSYGVQVGDRIELRQ
jgi:uncharacterized protein